jgi:hypothetical protein
MSTLRRQDHSAPQEISTPSQNLKFIAMYTAARQWTPFCSVCSVISLPITLTLSYCLIYDLPIGSLPPHSRLKCWRPSCYMSPQFDVPCFDHRNICCRSKWPRGLRRGSAAARLLRLWDRIPPGAWMSVCCESCVLSGRGFCDELIIRLEESYPL